MKSKYVSGFTILEALISLILTGIIIGLVYSLYTLIDKQLLSFKNESIQLNSYNLYDTLLKEDMSSSTIVYYDQSSIILKRYNEEEITYKTNNNKLLRIKDGVADTLNIEIVNMSIIEQYKGVVNVNYDVKLYDKVINTNYYIDKCNAKVINEQFFN